MAQECELFAGSLKTFDFNTPDEHGAVEEVGGRRALLKAWMREGGQASAQPGLRDLAGWPVL